jgi:hypothetical protein
MTLSKLLVTEFTHKNLLSSENDKLKCVEQLLLYQQLLLRQHCGHAFVLPTTHRPMDTPGAGSAFLCASAAKVHFIFGSAG